MKATTTFDQHLHRLEAGNSRADDNRVDGWLHELVVIFPYRAWWVLLRSTLSTLANHN